MVAIHRYDSDGTSGSESGDDTAPNNINRNSNNNSNSNSSSNLPPSSWRGWKERGKQAYLKGDYASALQNYSQALHRQDNIYNSFLHTQSTGSNNSSSNMFPSRLDRQILLSNMVACRLKLGGAPQAEAAVANAQKCVSIDPQWAKGHLRLAEAYLALGKSTSNHEKRLESSNKACEVLQKVIDLDPTNQAARNLLTKEFRYSALHGESDSSRAAPEPSAPPEHMDENRSQSSINNGNSPNQEQSTRSNEEHQQQYQQEEDNNTDGIDIEDDSNYVFTPSWRDRLEFWVQKVRTWYTGLSDDDKSLVKLGVLLVVLYVAFGGRFGFEYVGKNNTPSRRSSAAYDEFYQSRSGIHNRHDSNSYHRHGGNSYGSSSGYRHSDRSSSSSWFGGNSRGNTSSYRSCSSFFGGHYSYILLVLCLSYIGKRFFGIGPIQVLFFVNMLTGRRNNRRYDPRRRYGWGQDRYYNPRAQYRVPPRGMWR